MTAHHIKFEKRDDGIAILTIDRAEKRNAMTYAMLAAFIGKVRDAAKDDSVRVLIVTGAGGTFCAGTDLADLATIPGETRGVRGEAHENDVWWPLVSCPKPVIGAIDGYAVGMGAEFSSQCDVRIITPRTRFAPNPGTASRCHDASVIVVAPESSAPRKMNGKQRTLLTWFG